VLGPGAAPKELTDLVFDEDKEHLAKVTPDLRALLKDSPTVRLEVILAATPDDADKAWRNSLIGASPNVVLEGRLGPVVTLKAPAKAGDAFAKLSLVSTVRLPRSGQQEVVSLPDLKTDNAEALKGSGMDALHKKGHRGKKIRLAIVDGDFRGYDKL